MTSSNVRLLLATIMLGSWLGGCAVLKHGADSDADTADEMPEAVVTAPRDRNAPLPVVSSPAARAQAEKAGPQYRQALELLRAGKEDEALAAFRDLSKQYPELSGPVLNQALILQKRGNLKDAESLLKKFSAGPTRNPRVLNQQGVTSRQLGHLQEARQAYQAAISLAPDYDRPHYNLAVLADIYLGDTLTALAEFEKFQALQETRDKKVDGWIKDLRRRAGLPVESKKTEKPAEPAESASDDANTDNQGAPVSNAEEGKEAPAADTAAKPAEAPAAAKEATDE